MASKDEYSPENESGRCSKATYFLLLLRWLKDGVATLEHLTDDSTDIGHYYKKKILHLYNARDYSNFDFSKLYVNNFK